MEESTDDMIISLMDQLKYINIKIKSRKSLSHFSKLTSSPEDQLTEVLAFYSDVLEQLWKIADGISKSTEDEEERVGTLYMGSSWEGTYLPEIADSFDTYVMEEDTQTEMQNFLIAIDSEQAEQVVGSKSLLEVLRTEQPGYYLLAWTEYALLLKSRQEAKQGENEVKSKDEKAKEANIFFCYLNRLTEETEMNGKNILVFSPLKLRKLILKNGASTLQGFSVWNPVENKNSPAITFYTEEFKRNGTIKKITIADAVFGIRTTMPCLNQKWIEGKEMSSKWLTKDLLSKLRENKSFVVAKSWESEQENLVLWRISYSVVERQVIKPLPQEPKMCLIILKAVRRKFLSEPKGLVTYHLKTVLFYHLDKVGSDWKAEDRAGNILDLLDALAEALKNRSLPLFFEPDINTLGGMDEKTAADLEMKTRKILGSPRVLMSGSLFQSMDESHKKEHFQKGKDEVVAWFDEKPPEPKLLSDEDLKD